MASLPRPSQCQVLSRSSACPSSPARRHPPAPPTPTGCSSGYPGTPLPQRCGCRRNPVRLPLRYSRGSAAEPNCSAQKPEWLRNAIHPGVDPIAILRAIYVRLRLGDVQGASTIEQQFVRVVSGRHERTLARKVYEQVLAVCVSRRRRKAQIARAYLTIAYYGSAVVGMVGLRATFGGDVSPANIDAIREMIARLKYPEPSRPTTEWRRKVRTRVTYIELREAGNGKGSVELVSCVRRVCTRLLDLLSVFFLRRGVEEAT